LETRYYMKQFIRNANAKQLIALVTLIIISLAVWFDGPLLVIKNQYPLHQVEKRLYIIAFLFFVWLLDFIFSSPPAKAKILIPTTPEIHQKLAVLRGRFQGAFRFLKKTLIHKHGKSVNLASLPLYLLIGPAHSGKTCLLAKATVPFMLTKQFKHDKITAGETCDWWATREMVIVDVPSHYLIEKYKILWETTLKLIKYYRKAPTPLNAVIVTLPFPELIKQQHLQQKKLVMEEMKQKILQLRAQFGSQLNFYFIITKCDHLPGFNEFFSESSIEELAQAWGITIPTPKQNESLSDIFTQRFNALIKRLNNQLIWRLHQERNANTRPAIKDLPLHMERLKETLCDFLKLLSLTDLHLQGVYLTSALQPTLEEHIAHSQSAALHTNQPLHLLNIPPSASKPYFIKQLILQGLLTTTESKIILPVTKHHTKRWQKRVAYVASVMTIMTAAVLLGHDFQQSMLETYAIYNNLTQFQFAIQQPGQDGAHLLKALPLLNSLQTAAFHKNNKLSHVTNILSFYSNKSHQTASTVYQQALQKIVFPAIKNYFENYLQTASNKNPAQLYAVLKAYLMLGDQEHLQADYIISTLKQMLPTTLSSQANTDLVSHLHAAAACDTFQPLALNNDLIAHMRNRLFHLPSQDLALVILKNSNQYNASSDISFSTQLGNPPVFISNEITHPIPNMYTANAFLPILSHEISVVSNEALRGNWILGPVLSMPNDAITNALTQQVQARYIANYVDTWENVIVNLKLKVPNNLAQLDAMITNLTSNSSPLLQILQTIKQNTSFESITTASPKIEALNNLLVNAHNSDGNPLYQIFVTLRQLNVYLQKILNTTDVGSSAFEVAKYRAQTSIADPITQTHLLAEQNAEPMKNWLNNLATKSWYFILQETSQHIENAWQVNIMTIYKSQLANQDGDIEQFANFVGKQGTLASYYQHYLKPFINDTGEHWQWRVIENQRLAFSNNIPSIIQKAAKFQTMSKYALFTQGREHLAQHDFQLPSSLLGVTPLTVAEED